MRGLQVARGDVNLKAVRPTKGATRRLVIFTSTYPYGRGEQFLETELTHLKATFPRITVVPAATPGSARRTLTSVDVDTSLADSRKHGVRHVVMAAKACLFSKDFFGQLGSKPSILLRYATLSRLVRFIYDANLTAKWLNSHMKCAPEASSSIVLYTYWFDAATLGMALTRRRRSNLPIVTRAHGYDIYEDRRSSNLHPVRSKVLDSLDGVFVVSEHGCAYLRTRYPEASRKFHLSRLGVEDPGFVASPSCDGVLRVVSCSFVVPVKRLHLLIEGLTRLSHANPELQVEWTHIGDGPLRSQLMTCAELVLPRTVQWRFLGELANPDVLAFYKTHPVDVFANCSEAEGIPVAIMEAQSCGIPVVATKVGGTPEIVNSSNGVLLSANPRPEEVASALASFANLEWAAPKRINSRETWRISANANVNYTHFAQQLHDCAGLGESL